MSLIRSRSHIKVKVTSRSKVKVKVKCKNDNFTHFILCILLQIINVVKVTYQGQSENCMSFQFHVVHTVAQAGGLHSTEMHSCSFWGDDPLFNKHKHIPLMVKGFGKYMSKKLISTSDHNGNFLRKSMLLIVVFVHFAR